MKRILHIIGTMNRAGAETMLMNLYRVLDKKKYQFDFLYFTDKHCDYDDEILSLGGKIYRVSNGGFVNRFVETYRFLKNNKDFYAVHSHTLLNNGTNLFAAYLTGHKRRISHSHNTSNGPSATISSSLYYKFSKYLINTFSNGFIACGFEAGEYLYDKKNKFLFLPNAVNFDDFKSTELEIRNEINISNETILICQIGRFLSVKNHVFTVDLAKYMMSQNIDFHIVFVGDGLLKPKIQEKVKANKLESKVTFMGLRKDIPSILKSADCMIMPSIHEGFPVVLVESQVSGTPSLISSDIAAEVDLGVDLVRFESLSSNFELWSNKIKEIKNLKKTDTLFLSVLREKGFDIKSSLEILLKYYANV
jgi:glycosyltransferase EpsF